MVNSLADKTEHKQGYKKTELGWIPEDWSVASIGEVLDYEQPSKYIVSDTNYSNKNSTPVLTANKAFVLGYTDETEGIYKNTPVIIFDDFTVDNKYVDFDFKVKSSAIKILKPKNNNVNLKFIFEAMQIINFPTGGEHKRYYISEYQNSKIALPSKQEQQKIAEILSTVDEKIEKVEKQVKQAEQLKKALMQELLTKGIGHTEFKITEIGCIPASWDVVKFTSIAEKISDGIHTTPKYTESSEFYFINGNNLKNARIEITENNKCVDIEEFNKHKKDLGPNTILLSINGTIGNLAFYNQEQVILGKSACFINLKSNINKLFVYFVLATEKIKTYFDLELTGTTIRNLSIKSIKNTPIPLPSDEEQKKIAEILSSVDQKLEILQNKKSEYEKLKKGLMQKLLTGQIRVKITDEQARPQLKVISNEKAIQAPKFTVEEMAQEVISYWNTYRKINMQEVAKRKGILVYEDTIPPKGQCNYNAEKNRWEIAVQDLSDNYTIGHEIAHFIEHPEQVKLGAVARNGENSLSKKEEFDAELIASEIVMPYEILEEYLQEEGATRDNMLEINFMKQCAKRFSVSPIAMNRRLKSLDYKVPFIK